MATEHVTAVIAGASAVGGGAIVAGSNYWINRAQERNAEKQELRRTLVPSSRSSPGSISNSRSSPKEERSSATSTSR
jgi:hypothetical protein